MIRILVADDHAVVREGVHRIVSETEDLKVVGEASTGLEVLEQVAAQSWDVVLLDISLPGYNGIEVLRRLKQTYPGLPVLVFSMHAEHQYATRALRAGAAGYLTKDSLAEELVTAIRQVVQGGFYVNRGLAEHLALAIAAGDERPLHTRLTDREYQVLCLLAKGRTLSAIAEELALSIKTVNSHRSRILDKMNLQTTAGLIHYAIRHRLVESPTEEA
jgi:DNA-binding NarL/FixJ family response regulator